MLIFISNISSKRFYSNLDNSVCIMKCSNRKNWRFTQLVFGVSPSVDKFVLFIERHNTFIETPDRQFVFSVVLPYNQ